MMMAVTTHRVQYHPSHTPPSQNKAHRKPGYPLTKPYLHLVLAVAQVFMGGTGGSGLKLWLPLLIFAGEGRRLQDLRALVWCQD